MINTTVEIAVDCREWYLIDDNIEGICQETITKVFENGTIPVRSSRREIGLLLTTNDRMVDLNKVYRKKMRQLMFCLFQTGYKDLMKHPFFLVI